MSEQATPAEIAAARARHCVGDDEIEIDNNMPVLVSHGDEGYWVQAWVWVPYEEESTK